MPSRRRPQVRIGSPDTGASTLITSAPNSPSAVAAIGPATSVAASTTRTPASGPRASVTFDDGTCQSEMVTQGRPGVVVTEEPAALQFRHHQTHDILVGTRGVGRGDDEPIARVGREPLLHLVGHLRSGAHEARALKEGGAMSGQVGQGDVVADVLTEVLDETT